MLLDDAPQPGHALLAHLRRHPFLPLSLALHAALFGALGYLNVSATQRSELARQQRAVDYGERLTERVRLEKRVHDMARIKSLLEQSTSASAGARADDGAQFSAPPRTPDALLKQATELSRAIEKLERDNKAVELARLLHIPKDKALEKIAQAPKPAEPPATRPMHARDAAAKIEQLEARARAALEQRRQQLERQQNGVKVAADAQQARSGLPRAGASDGGKGESAGAPGAAQAGQGDQAGLGGQDKGDGITGGAPGASLLARIDAFANPDLPDRATQAYATGGLQGFFDRGIGRIPDVDAGAMVKGSGRLIGPGGAHANRVYVNQWYLIGPFEGRHGEGLFSNLRHPPEQGVALDAVYRGKDGRLLRWDYVDMASYPLIPPDHAEDAVYYGYTELMVDREQDLTIWVGADDDAQLWLNDRLVWRGGDVNKTWFFGEIYDRQNTLVRDYNLSEGKRVVHFRQGRNKLFFKLSNGPTRLFFSLVLTK